MSRDIIKYIAANSEVSIPLNGDKFLYLKEAPLPVYVAADQERLEMSQGDKTVFDGVVSEVVVSNTSENRIRVVVTVGRGDYERLFVSGEIALKEHVSTLALGSKSLPVEFRKEFGLVDDQGVSFEAGEIIGQTPTVSMDNGDYARAYFVYENRIYLLMEAEVHQYELDGTHIATSAYAMGATMDFIRGADVDENGTAWVLQASGISKVNLYSLEIVEAYSPNSVYGNSYGYGVSLVDGKLHYAFSAADGEYGPYQRIETYDIKTGTVGLLVLNGEPTDNYSHTIYFDHVGGVFAQAGYGGSLKRLFDKSGNYVGTKSSPASQGGGFVYGKRNIHIVSMNNYLRIHAVDDVEYAARLYVQDVGDVASRREYYIKGDYGFVVRPGGVALRGNIVSAVLQGLDVGGGLKNNYLDYVVSIEYTDGNYVLKKDAGSSSFAWRGYQDFGELLLESEAAIRLLPEYLTGAI